MSFLYHYATPNGDCYDVEIPTHLDPYSMETFHQLMDGIDYDPDWVFVSEEVN